jgi:ElaB/YqjD/DUF883 family membrane-anchored ribosome-binding protein
MSEWSPRNDGRNKKKGWIMVDKKNMADAAQNVAATVREAANAAQDCVGKGADMAGEYADKGYNAAREYTATARESANAGVDVAARMSGNLSEFVRNEPWIAIAAACAIGYVAARIMRRLSI